MSRGIGILSYEDCRVFLDQALKSKDGTGIELPSEKDAVYYRHRCNRFRQLDRKKNKILYPEGHRMHEQSPYDILELTIRGRVVRAIPHSFKGLRVIDLETGEEIKLNMDDPDLGLN